MSLQCDNLSGELHDQWSSSPCVGDGSSIEIYFILVSGDAFLIEIIFYLSWSSRWVLVYDLFDPSFWDGFSFVIYLILVFITTPSFWDGFSFVNYLILFFGPGSRL